jgi:hypothetical protein
MKKNTLNFRRHFFTVLFNFCESIKKYSKNRHASNCILDFSSFSRTNLGLLLTNFYLLTNTARLSSVITFSVALGSAHAYIIALTSQETLWLDDNKCGPTTPNGAWLPFLTKNDIRAPLTG